MTNKRKILILDDESDFCEVLESIAIGVGYQVFSTTKCNELPLLYSDELDCIAFELSISDINGIDPIKFLSEQSSQASILIISGWDVSVIEASKNIAQAHGLNVVAALQKPIRKKNFENLLHNILPLNLIEKNETASGNRYGRSR